MSYAERQPLFGQGTLAETNVGSSFAIVPAPGATSAIRVIRVYAAFTRASPAGANSSGTWADSLLGTFDVFELLRASVDAYQFTFPGHGYQLAPNAALLAGGILNVAGPSTVRFGCLYLIDSVT